MRPIIVGGPPSTVLLTHHHPLSNHNMILCDLVKTSLHSGPNPPSHLLILPFTLPPPSPVHSCPVPQVGIEVQRGARVVTWSWLEPPSQMAASKPVRELRVRIHYLEFVWCIVHHAGLVELVLL